MRRAPDPPWRPKLRGWSHVLGFFVSLIAGTVLYRGVGDHARSLVLVYTVSLSALLGVSSLYHRILWSDGPRAWVRRLDHAMIFVLIGGSSTPFALALPQDARAAYLTIVWGACAVGSLRSIFWPFAPKWVAAGTSLAVGWGIASFVPRMSSAFPPGVLVLVIAGGVTYSLGALCYALKRPNPWPGVFGYHEVFHALVLAAAAMQYVAVQRMVG